jgi:hypothetical protein
MAYQMNKDTKILLVLLAVVVLCSAKLFKDYLYRNRYVEGMTVVSQESNVQLRRPTEGSITADIMFTISLGADLPMSSGALSIAWAGAAAATGDVVFSTAGTSYTATASGYTIQSPSTLGPGNKATFGSSSANIPSGRQVVITIKGITINSKTTSAVDKITFTITAGSESPVIKDVSILPYVNTGQTAGASQFTASTSASVSEIQSAIMTINARLAPGVTPPPDTNEVANLTRARSALIALLASTYGTIKEAGQVFESGALYEAQKTAIDFISKEKARAASNADVLSSDNLNKRRMAQINTYYTRNYEANTDVMKNVIYVSIAMIILAVLRKKELIPGSISTLGVIFILTMGGIIIGGQVFDIMRRNDHDFDKYDWNFNEDQLNKHKLIQMNSDPANLSDMGIGGAPCYGASCCDAGTVWDPTGARCVPGSRISGSSTWAAETKTLTVTLTTSTGLVSGDSVTVKLPPGLFSRTNPSTRSQASGSSLTYDTTNSSDDSHVLTASGSISAGTITITITGLSVNESAKYGSTKVITAFTSKESNPSSLGVISGI